MPASGSIKPEMILRSVDLPQPDGPRMVSSSPSRTLRSTTSTATVRPKVFLTPISSSTGVGGLLRDHLLDEDVGGGIADQPIDPRPSGLVIGRIRNHVGRKLLGDLALGRQADAGRPASGLFEPFVLDPFT